MRPYCFGGQADQLVDGSDGRTADSMRVSLNRDGAELHVVGRHPGQGGRAVVDEDA